MLVALVPHLYFFYERGREWNGTFPLTHDDEITYAAHLSALIDGRSRHADPYTGRDDATGQAAGETYLSLQFIPPLVLNETARLVHLESLELFFGLTIVSAAAAFVCLYWFFGSLFDDPKTSAGAALAVLCLGTAHVWLGYLVFGSATSNYLGFLRRYVPAVPIPFLFLFFGAVWRMLVRPRTRDNSAWAIVAAFCFAVLVYSYFYLWTAAAAWLFILVVICLTTGGGRRGEFIRRFFPLIFIAGLTLIPFFILLTKRIGSTDEAMMIVRTHKPDLFRAQELIGLLTILLIGYAKRQKLADWSNPYVQLSLAFAITPVLVFNQQIITGRSLQSFHYSVFSVNYMVLIGLSLTGALFLKGVTRQLVKSVVLSLLVVASLSLGAFEGLLSGRKYLAGNVLRDEARPVMLEFAKSEFAVRSNQSVLCTDPTVADAFPTLSRAPVLWARHMFNHGITLGEDKERLSLYLYLSGANFENVVPANFDSLDNTRKYFISSLIGRARNIPYLRSDWSPISRAEIEGALAEYAVFVATMNRARVGKFELSSVVTRNDEAIDFGNLDRWYERSTVKSVGDFTIYRVKLRAQGL